MKTRAPWTAALAAATALLGPGVAEAAFVPAAQGCPMAHCSPSMSDLVRMRAPGSVGSTWSDKRAAADSQGLGCSANGRLAVCTVGDRSGKRDRSYLRAYDGRGTLLWHSKSALNSWAWTSAPMVDKSGGVIAADDSRVVRFRPGGAVRWSSQTPGGAPVSPTRTARGTIVLATSGGPISAYDPDSGRRLATLDLRATLDGLSGRFDTRNTAAVRGNRIYVSTEFKLDDGRPDPHHHARLYAIDVDPGRPREERLRVAWYHEFGARSGASPLVVGDMILFDGDRETASSAPAPRFFGLRDEGSTAAPVWQYPLGGPGTASAARDPRGGAWVYAFGQPTLRRISTADGTVRQTLDLDRIVGEPGRHTPYSAISIAEDRRGKPVMLVSARAGRATAYLVAIDLVHGRAMWKYKLPGDVLRDTPMGQFPIIKAPKHRRSVVFTTKSGVRAVSGR